MRAGARGRVGRRPARADGRANARRLELPGVGRGVPPTRAPAPRRAAGGPRRSRDRAADHVAADDAERGVHEDAIEPHEREGGGERRRLVAGVLGAVHEPAGVGQRGTAERFERELKSPTRTSGYASAVSRRMSAEELGHLLAALAPVEGLSGQRRSARGRRPPRCPRVGSPAARGRAPTDRTCGSPGWGGARGFRCRKGGPGSASSARTRSASRRGSRAPRRRPGGPSTPSPPPRLLQSGDIRPTSSMMRAIRSGSRRPSVPRSEDVPAHHPHVPGASRATPRSDARWWRTPGAAPPRRSSRVR